MLKKKLIGSIFGVLLILIFIFSPFRFNTISFKNNKAEAMERWTIDQDTTWKKEDNILINKVVTIENGATLTIEKGSVIRFSQGGGIYIPSLNVSDGSIVAKGSEDEKIIFTPDSEDDQYTIKFYDSDPKNNQSFFRYVEFQRGGCNVNLVMNKHSWISTAYAGITVNSFNFISGNVHIENSAFKNSRYSDVSSRINDVLDEEGNYINSSLTIVNSNFEGSNYNTALESYIYCSEGNSACSNSLVLLKNNWYGNYQGPTQESDLDYKGEVIYGDYTLDGYRTNELIADPVIVTPGIMGSATQYIGGIGELKLDPILHTYDNLIASFKENGYEEGKNLFEFPYEWRDSNILTAGLLKQKIQDVKNETKISKVDLVAHSMGGLVARYYIEEPGYQDDVDQLITLGTPHKGAPESYLKWEAGEGFEDPLDKIAKAIFQIEAHVMGYNDLKEYIQARVKSVQELLPDYDYLKEASNGEIRSYPNNYPRNTFLEFLNNQTRVDNLSKVNLFSIIGNTNSDKTIKEFSVVDGTVSGKWEHGMPENFYNSEISRGIEYGKGDETVPLSSAKGIASNKEEEVDFSHMDLPTKAQCYAIKELTGKDNCEYVSTFDRITNILTFGVFSPIDIQVVAPDGKRTGKNFETGEIINEITGAFYSGFDTDNEFLTIPNPVDGEYKVLTQGTENGTYKIEAKKIAENTETGIASESTAKIEGAATTGQEEEKEVKVEGENVSAGNQDTTPPTITGSATTQPNASGWYNNDVIIHFEATDNESGIDTITPDITLTNEGENQSATGTAKDKAGNEASFTVSGINIDKTAPEINISSPESKNYLNNQTITIDYSVLDNINEVASQVYYDNKLTADKNINLSFQNLGEHVLKITAMDEAGNQSEKEVKFQIRTSTQAIIDNIKNYSNQELIKNLDKTVLISQLNLIQEIDGIIKLLENSVFLNDRMKVVLVKALKNQANSNLNWLIGYAQQRSKAGISNGIDPKIGSLLIEDLNFIKYK